MVWVPLSLAPVLAAVYFTVARRGAPDSGSEAAQPRTPGVPGVAAATATVHFL